MNIKTIKKHILKKLKEIEDIYEVPAILLITLTNLVLTIIIFILLGWGVIHIILEQIRL